MNTKIYLLLEVPVLGELGLESKITREEICSDCGQLKVIYEHIDFKFDRWNGEDLISAYGIYFGSERLVNKFKELSVSGIDYQVVSNSKAETFKIGSKAYVKTLPDFYHLTFTGSAKGPDLWWEKKSTCKTCGDIKWFPTREGIRSENGPSTTGTKKDEVNPLPRRVFTNSWQGEDAFLLEDPVAFPIVTEKFKKITDEFKNEKIFYRPTEWIEQEI